MEPILNVCGYRFVAIDDALLLRERLHSQATALGLKGSVILAPEGINFALAGQDAQLRDWIGELRRDTRFAELDLRFSVSAAVPFQRLLIKVKREIIRMNQPMIAPQRERAPSVDAPSLERWLDGGHDDRGRELVLLDTRNGFEVDHGRFRGALDWRLRSFSDFTGALRERRRELDGKTVVSYCTGGIRCEKAALWMRHEGIANVLQLDGGILKYFEISGASHFEGNCFVFDSRTCLDSSLVGERSRARQADSWGRSGVENGQHLGAKLAPVQDDDDTSCGHHESQG
ncbi:MAG: sulfurtransferase [Burkholderiaceae bacterium]